MNALPKGFPFPPRNEYVDEAADQRASDFNVALAWVDHQYDNGWATLRRELAQMLVGADCADWRDADADAVDKLRTRFSEDVLKQPETTALAYDLQEADEEAEREDAEAARYARECEDSIPPRW